jgi:two-component system chemotaxis sensor kinase CheA
VTEPLEVLIVEDMSTIRLLLKGMVHTALKLRPVNIREAFDGELGWALARERVPRVIFSDVEMPRLDGIALTERLRADPAFAQTSVVLLTSLSELKQRGLHAGANAFLSKPLRLDELKQVLASVLGT